MTTDRGAEVRTARQPIQADRDLCLKGASFMSTRNGLSAAEAFCLYRRHSCTFDVEPARIAVRSGKCRVG